MVLFVRIFSFFTSAFLIFFSCVMLLVAPEEERSIAYVFLFIGLFFLLLGFKYKGQPKNQLNTKVASTKHAKPSLEVLDINRIVMQVLESIEIISNTKNIDTLKSRQDFLEKVFEELCIAYNTKNYRREALATIDAYKQLYYDKDVNEYQLTAVTNPMSFNLNAFACVSIMNCFFKNAGFQQNTIDQLKTERGKLGRYKKLYENLNESILLISHKYNSEVSSQCIEKLQPIKKSIESKLN